MYVTGSLTIGDFSRVTFLSVKTLRHYHRAGLLEPADVDPVTGYRRYASDQIPIAQVIRRFRELNMPLEDIGSVLRASDQTVRSALIAAHLARLEETLAETQRAVASLRDLLEHPSPSAVIEHRQVPATQAAAITSVVDVGDLAAWYHGALGELVGTLSAQGVVACGPPGGIYANELFTEERGDAALFLPMTGGVRPVGRVGQISVSGVELALIVHNGSHSDLDRSYGALATYVTEHAVAVDGLIREYYVVGPKTLMTSRRGGPRLDGRSSRRGPTGPDAQGRTPTDSHGLELALGRTDQPKLLNPASSGGDPLGPIARIRMLRHGPARDCPPKPGVAGAEPCPPTPVQGGILHRPGTPTRLAAVAAESAIQRAGVFHLVPSFCARPPMKITSGSPNFGACRLPARWVLARIL